VYRFLITPKWIAAIIGMALAITAMIGLGRWQWDRLYATRAANAAIAASAKAKVVSADTLLPTSPKDKPKASSEWRRVSVTGSYLVDKTVLIRGSTNDDGVGFEVVVPFKATDGRIYLVDRGFVLAPSSADQLPAIPDAPKGQVDVTGRVRVPYASISSDTKIQPIQGMATVRALNTEGLAESLKLNLSGGYISALTEKAADGATYPKIERIALPELDDGPHLSYAIQWWLFATIAFGGFIYIIKRDADQRLLDDDEWDDDWDDDDDDGGGPPDDDDPDGPDVHAGADSPPDGSKYSTKVLH